MGGVGRVLLLLSFVSSCYYVHFGEKIPEVAEACLNCRAYVGALNRCIVARLLVSFSGN